MTTPWPLRGDAYTAASQMFAGRKAIERSTYYLANRRSPRVAWPGVARDDRMVLYGLSDWIGENLSEPVTREDVDRSAAFMGTAHALGGPLNFDRKVWDRVVDEYGGHLPLLIEALPDGSCFFPGEPAIQVSSLGEGFGEVAAIVEATLLGTVACATARATVTRHLLEWMRGEVRKDGLEPEAARWLVHDFGMRASPCPREAELLGKAHLLSFHGTDTFNAAYSAWYSDESLRPTGTSILAHAHRIVCGHDDEEDAVQALAMAAEMHGSFPIASYLADTYDTRTCVNKLLIPLALEYQKRGKGVVVCRCDSGDLIENLDFVIDRAMEAGLYGRSALLNRYESTHLRVILGDSMDPEKMGRVLDHLRARRLAATSWVTFGIGGWLRRQGDRDLLSSAYKLSAKGLSDEPVVKLSETRAKMSIPGPVDLTRAYPPDGRPTVRLRRGLRRLSAYAVHYDGDRGSAGTIRPVCHEAFTTVRDRAIDDFDAFAGCGGFEVLSPEVVAIQEEVMRNLGRII